MKIIHVMMKNVNFNSNSKEGNCRKCYDVYNLENGIWIKTPFLPIYIINETECPKSYFTIGIRCNVNCLGA